jgi:hypothetical protein
MTIASESPTITSANGKGRVQILSRRDLDGRSAAARRFDSVVAGIAADLGGEDRLSTVQQSLVEAFAGVAIMVDAANVKLLLGEEVDIVEHAQVVSTLTRVASRIGLGRIPRDIGPTLGDILREDLELQRQQQNSSKQQQIP